MEGRYLDMEMLYHKFQNLQKLRKGGFEFGGYLWYLSKFDQFHEIPSNLKEKSYK